MRIYSTHSLLEVHRSKQRHSAMAYLSPIILNAGFYLHKDFLLEPSYIVWTRSDLAIMEQLPRSCRFFFNLWFSLFLFGFGLVLIFGLKKFHFFGKDFFYDWEPSFKYFFFFFHYENSSYSSYYSIFFNMRKEENLRGPSELSYSRAV